MVTKKGVSKKAAKAKGSNAVPLKDAGAKKHGSAPLPRKEGEQFKALIKLHETRMYKKALKTADQILKKFPDHGETLAMKGLLLQVMGRKEEAEKAVTKGLANHKTSYIAWHVRALMYRLEKNYPEAQKCFAKAIEYDTGIEPDMRLSESGTLWRDLSFLQLQLRDLEGFKRTREQMVRKRPALKVSWIALLVAHHLVGDHEKAIIIINEYIETLERNANKYGPAEDSQVLLYRLTLLREAGKLDVALATLEQNKTRILDKTALKETEAELLMALGRKEESASLYRQLIVQNQERLAHYEGLEKALGLEPTDVEARYKHYQELRQMYQRSQTLRVLPLRFLTGKLLETEIRQFLERNLQRGIPTAFQNLKIFYKSKTDYGKEHIQLVEKLLLEFKANIEHKNRLHLQDDEPCLPGMTLFVDMYLAMHYDLVGAWSKALVYIDKAIAHTPTMVDLYTTKGKILKHAGAFREAMDVMDTARVLDTADRFLNSVCVKYMLRADDIDVATSTIEKFTKETPQGRSNLVEMQCIWFHLEVGAALVRKGDLARAIKTYMLIDANMNEFLDDQFDFHPYCMFKMTLSSYISTLRYEDRLRSCTEYVTCAMGVIEICLDLLAPTKDDTVTKEKLAKETRDRKKALSKQRRANAKAVSPAAADVQTKDAKDGKKPVKPVVEDTDADGAIFFAEVRKDPLKLATSMLQPLLNLCDDRMETHVCAFRVYLHKKKTMPMLRALLRMHQLDALAEHFGLFVVRFMAHFESVKSTLAPVFLKVVEKGISQLLKDLTLEQKLDAIQVTAKESKKVMALWNIACAKAEMRETDKQALRAVVVDLPADFPISVVEGMAIYKELLNGPSPLQDAETAAQWKYKMAQLYPKADAFGYIYEGALIDDSKAVVE